MRRKRTAYGGPLCPIEGHGELLSFEGVRGYWCPHDGHDPKSENDTPPSAWYTQEQIEQQRG